ncbi:MAG TPA: hypothetical protein VFS48_04540 [Solirubrobacterales bacterium]|nr:hypothetical protein [Solirubrobacterales bacterium]
MKRRLSIYALGAILLLAGGPAAEGALVRVGRIVVQADGGFTPRVLPRRAYAPIEFHGYADVRSTDSGPVPAVRQVRLDFDRDGLLGMAGLAICNPTQLQGTTTDEARRRCAKALVGTGHVAAEILRPGLSGLAVRAPLSFFNGPRIDGKPTAIAHSRTLIPSPETYVITIPIEPRDGAFSYRATIDVPAIAGGEGVLTHVDAKVGKKYRYKGRERSYVSARCSDGVLETRGRLLFEEGTVIEGSVYRGCTPEGGF